MPGGVINVMLVVYIVHRKHLVQKVSKDEETISSMANVEEDHFNSEVSSSP